MHVQAKRYLVATQKNYYNRLSAASIETLKWQGGPMSQEEILQFKNQCWFDDIIKVRLWDEGAKENDAKTFPLEYFRALLVEYLLNRN
jgi:predicted HD phosphohydrolase